MCQHADKASCFRTLAANPAVTCVNRTSTARWLEQLQWPPRFVVPESAAVFESLRVEMRRQLWELLGKLPARPKSPKVEIVSCQPCDDYLVEKLKIDNGAGAVAPGYLLLPRERRVKAPAILFCHWHGGDYAVGKEELFQASHCPEPPGPAFARCGFVVLGIDAYCFGERNGEGPGSLEQGLEGESSASKFNLWFGRTLWGMILRDDLIALDYLVTRLEVDPERIGVTGISMGATRAWWLMALDERIKTAVAVACLTRYQNLIEHQAINAHGIYYFVPNFLAHFDTEAVISLLAPRPVLFQTGDQDAGSPADGIRSIEKAVVPAYRLYGKQQNFQNRVYSGLGHVYAPEMWAETLAWMKEKLQQR